jgi:hypothetical protein
MFASKQIPAQAKEVLNWIHWSLNKFVKDYGWFVGLGRPQAEELE